MSEKKIENQILWFVVAIMILVLYTLITTMLYGDNEYLLIGKLIDPIAIFSGALIGALISGKIANDIHKKEFQRLETVDKRDNSLVRSVLFHYIFNIDRTLKNVRINIIDLDSFRKSFEIENFSTTNRLTMNGFISIKSNQLIQNLEYILEEYYEMCEVSVEKLELESLMHFLKYKSLMRHVAIPIIESAIKNESLILSDFEKVKEINTDFLKVNE